MRVRPIHSGRRATNRLARRVSHGSGHSRRASPNGRAATNHLPDARRAAPGNHHPAGAHPHPAEGKAPLPRADGHKDLLRTVGHHRALLSTADLRRGAADNLLHPVSNRRDGDRKATAPPTSPCRQALPPRNANPS